MSPIFIIAMVIVWFVVSQAKKAARQGMASGAKSLGRKARISARRRIENYRDTVRGRRDGVENQIERAADELEDRWSRAEQMLGGPDDEYGDEDGDEYGDEYDVTEASAEESWPDWVEPSLEEEIETSPLTVPEELPPMPEPRPDSPREAAPPPLPQPQPKPTPTEVRAAAAAAATAAAAAAAAAAAELAQKEAESAPSEDELTESIEADLTVAVLETDLFESGRPGFEIEERFREEFRGRRVRWSGRLDRAETTLVGGQVEIIVHEVDDDPLGRPLRWTFDLPRAEAEDLISQREIPLTIEGTLDGCDPYLRQVKLTNARREAE